MLDGYEIVEDVYHSQSTQILRAIREADGQWVLLKIRRALVAELCDAGLRHEYEIGESLAAERLLTPLSIRHTAQESILVLPDDKMVSLDTLIPESGFELARFFTLAIELATALAELHGCGVIHREINPTNIIVNDSLDAVKLIDFGLATRIREELVDFVHPSLLPTTLAYMAPEQSGRVNIPLDLRSDLYSLGITFYQMLTGTLPFAAHNPFELLISHVAKVPLPVFEIKPDIPQALSRVIEKLLEKSPDARYSTAVALKEDLLYLQQGLAEGRRMLDFNPRANRFRGELILPRKLYGRKEEQACLLKCFFESRVAMQVVTVSGAAGSGKTALLGELYTPALVQKGFFLYGKFDQQDKGLAYTALADVLKDFVRQVLGQDTETLDALRGTLGSAMGRFGQVLIDIAPEFGRLLDAAPRLASVSPPVAIARRNWVFSTLIEVVCSLGRPLVIFLDDLQWADQASLSVLETIIGTADPNLLILLAYRDAEFSGAHPLGPFLHALNSNPIALTRINLNNLSKEVVTAWLNDSLPHVGSPVEALQMFLMAKTDGNPLHITLLLRLIIEQCYISSSVEGSFLLDMEGLRTLSLDANVSAHLTSEIKNLADEEREFLVQLSILGHRFSLERIAQFLGKGHCDYQAILRVLLGLRLLVKQGHTLRFSHDLVQQAARGLLDTERACGLHLQAGRNIEGALAIEGQAEDRVAEYLYHYNAAADLITAKQQRLGLAKANALLGRRLKNNLAYRAAERAFVQAIAFLPPLPFEADYDLTVDLLMHYGEILSLNSKDADAEKQFETVLAHARSPLERAKVYVKQINLFVTQKDIKKSMQLGLAALAKLGVKLPKRWLPLTRRVDLLKVKALLRGRKPEEVLDLPPAKDALALAQLQVLSATLGPAYLAYPDYFRSIVFQLIKLSITAGSSFGTPYYYVLYAAILCHLGDVSRGYAYGKAALTLLDQATPSALSLKARQIFASGVLHWKAPARDAIDFLEEARAVALEIGDYEHAAFAAVAITQISFYLGENIDGLLQNLVQPHNILAGFGESPASFLAKYFQQVLITLHNPAGDGVTVSGAIVDEAWLISFLEERQLLQPLATCMVTKMLLAYLAGDYEMALRARARAAPLLPALLGDINNIVYYFFAALTCVAYYRTHAQDRSLLRDARQLLKKLKRWGGDAPQNYLYEAQLVEAELLSLHGAAHKVLELYAAAIENAHNAGNKLALGVACECMGRHLERIGLKSLGLIQIRRSVSVFQNWGALNKSHSLSEEYALTIDREGMFVEGIADGAAASAINARINLDLLARTIRALTGDLAFDSLLATLLDALMQSSGATRAVYIHVDQGVMYVRAEKLSGGNVSIYDAHAMRARALDLPTALIEEYYSGSCEYVLENIKFPGKTWADEQRTPRYKSVLMIPLKRRPAVEGIIYLENELLENAFRENQVQFLTLLAGQAAIAMGNALVFEKLNAEQVYSALIIDNALSLICGVDSHGVTKFINPAVEKVTGYRKDELIGKNWWDLFYPGVDAEQVKQLFVVLDRGEMTNFEMRLTCKDGTKRDIVWNNLAERSNSGEISEIISFGNDITVHKRTQEALRESEAQFRDIFEYAADAFFLSDTQGHFLKVNAAACTSLGYTCAELLQLSVLDIDVNYDLEKLAEVIKSLWRYETRTIDTELLRKDGTTFPVEINVRLLGTEKNPLILSLARDVSERNQVLVALKASENGLREAQKLAHLGHWLWDIKSGTVRWSDEVYRIFGLDPQVFEPQIDSIMALSPWPEYKKRQEEIVQRAIDNREIDSFEQKFLRPDGREVYCGSTFRGYYDDDEVLIAIGGTVQDITERKQSEMELQQLRNYLADIIDSMPSMLVGVDVNGRVTRWNQTAEKITEITAASALGQDLVTVFPQITSEMEKITTCILTRVPQQELKRRRVLGERLHYEDVMIYPLISNGVDGAVIRIDDITAKVHMEEMMIQTEKMLSVGGLAAGMAHEINNPLAGMVQTANVMANRLSEDIPANIKAAEVVGTSMEAIRAFMSMRGIPRMLAAIHESGQRVAVIVDNMLSFARRGDEQTSSYNISELLDKTVQLAGTDYDLKRQYDFRAIKLVRDYQSDLPMVICEGSKLQQVFLNVLRNGAEAMQEAGTENPMFELRTWYEKERDMVSIQIADNGPGMEESVRKRVFEPFFTTKPVGLGTGLGLSVAYFIVTKNHDGEMDVVSEPGKGSTFIIRLPTDNRRALS